MFWYTNEEICSKHKTVSAARKAIKKCEDRGGNKHWILEVKKIK